MLYMLQLQFTSKFQHINKMKYHVRLTKPFVILETFFRELQCENMVVYEHAEDEEIKRTHVHALITDPTSGTTTMKARLTKLCGVWKKEDWAFVTKYKSNDKNLPVDDKLITYMSKGCLEPSLVVGFTEEQITKYKDAWIEPETRKKVKPTYDAITKEVLRMTIGPQPAIVILNNVITVCNKYNVICGRYKIRDIFDSVYRRSNPTEFLSRMEDMCVFPVKKSLF